MTYGKPKPELSPNDRALTRRLGDQAADALSLIAKVVASNLALDPQVPATEFTLTVGGDSAADNPPVAVSVTITYQDGQQSCWEDPPGRTTPGPCPS